jgi:hypothetical protein
MSFDLTPNEDGTMTIPAELVREWHGENGLRATVIGESVTLQSMPQTPKITIQDPEAAWIEWDLKRQQVANELTSVWPAEVSAVDAISEQRR